MVGIIFFSCWVIILGLLTRAKNKCFLPPPVMYATAGWSYSDGIYQNGLNPLAEANANSAQ